MDFNLSGIDVAIVVVYFVGIVTWGLIHSARKSAEDYFLGGRGMKWPFVGLSMFAMVVSSSALVGWAGDAYSTGISVFNYATSGAIFVLVFVLVFFLPFYLKNKIYTLPEFLEGRYDRRSRLYFSGLSIVGYTFLDASVTLYAGALMLKMIFPGTELWLLVICLAAVAASYTIIGGLTSVMYADLLQSSFLLIGSVVLTITAFSSAGGWSSVMDNTPDDLLSLIRPLDDPSVPWPTLIISLPLLGFYFWGISQAMVQRTLSAKSINHGRWGNLFAAFLNFAIFFVMILPGIAGRSIFPDLEKADMIYPKLVFELLPKGLIGLVLAGLIAAMASTLSSILNSASTLFTMDIMSGIRPNMSSKQKVVIGNIAGLVIITISALWAPQIAKFDSMVKYFQELLSYLTPPIVATFVLGVFWKRATRHGAFAGLMSGFLIAAILLILNDHSPLRHIHFLYVAPVVFACSTLVIVITSLLTEPEEEEKISRYTWTVKLFREETLELRGTPWYQNFRIISIILVVITIIFMIYWR
jgi:SSS family solute:Na+ symporter